VAASAEVVIRQLSNVDVAANLLLDRFELMSGGLKEVQTAIEEGLNTQKNIAGHAKDTAGRMCSPNTSTILLICTSTRQRPLNLNHPRPMSSFISSTQLGEGEIEIKEALHFPENLRPLVRLNLPLAPKWMLHDITNTTRFHKEGNKAELVTTGVVWLEALPLVVSC
jgi:hypothetical protein